MISQASGRSAQASPASAPKAKPRTRVAGNLSDEEYTARELRQPGSYVSDFAIRKLQTMIADYYNAWQRLDGRELIKPQELRSPSLFSTPIIKTMFPVIVWVPGHWVFCLADGLSHDLYLFDTLFSGEGIVRDVQKRMFHLAPRTSSQERINWNIRPVRCQQQPAYSNDCAAFALASLDLYCQLVTKEKDAPPALDAIIQAMASTRHVACLARSVKNPP